MKVDQQENIFEDLLFKLESQIKRAESEIESKKNIALSKIVTTIETANSVKEIIKHEKLYDEVEKKYEQEVINQKKKIIKTYLTALEKLKKHLEKVYTKMLAHK